MDKEHEFCCDHCDSIFTILTNEENSKSITTCPFCGGDIEADFS